MPWTHLCNRTSVILSRSGFDCSGLQQSPSAWWLLLCIHPWKQWGQTRQRKCRDSSTNLFILLPGQGSTWSLGMPKVYPHCHVMTRSHLGQTPVCIVITIPNVRYVYSCSELDSSGAYLFHAQTKENQPSESAGLMLQKNQHTSHWASPHLWTASSSFALPKRDFLPRNSKFICTSIQALQFLETFTIFLFSLFPAVFRWYSMLTVCLKFTQLDLYNNYLYTKAQD